jgi:hypothetical protein
VTSLRVVGELAPTIVEKLALASRCATLAEALRFGDIIVVIVQDEYTHDVVVRGPAPAYLCFDTT